MQRDDSWTWRISGGPTFQIWARFPKKRDAACSEVSIAFRGTDFYSFADWEANALPTVFRADDHYRQLRRNINTIVHKIADLPCYKQKHSRVQIVSVGHSLGGGLAQFAGLADKRINKVFAFDASPVTGARLLDKKLREDSAQSLEIDRINQSTEVLAWVRPFAQQFPAKSSPCVRTVIYDVFPSIGVVGMHSMNGLARGLVWASYDQATGKQKAFLAPGKTARDCNSDQRYVRPTTDQDDYDEPLTSSNLSQLSSSRAFLANSVNDR